MTPTPDGDGRVYHEHQEQQRAQFGNSDPRIFDPLGERNRLSSQDCQVPQPADLPVVRIRHGEKVDDQIQQPQAADGIAKPQLPGVEIKPNKTYDGGDQGKHGDVRPPH